MTDTAPGPEPASQTSEAAGERAAEISPAAAVARRWLRTRKAVAALLLTVRLAAGAPGCQPTWRRPPHDR